MLHLLGYRLEVGPDYFLNRVIAKVYPSWSGHPRWIESRHELYLKDTRWMLSRARAVPLTFILDGVSFRGSRLAHPDKYRCPGDFRKVCHRIIGDILTNLILCGRSGSGGCRPSWASCPPSRWDRGTRPVVWRCVLVPVRPVHEAGIVWRRANDSVVYVLVYTSAV